MPTYRYRVADVTPVATATDVLELRGVAGKKITVSHISISGTATAASIYDVYITKRTTLNTGGASTNPTATPHSSRCEPHQAVLYLYTANPTLGTGTALDGDKVFFPAAATPVGGGGVTYNWGNRGDDKPELNGPNDALTINFNGAAVPAGASLYITIEWQEV